MEQSSDEMSCDEQEIAEENSPEDDQMEQLPSEQHDATEASKKRKVYLPGYPLNEDEVLEHDPSVYLMLHEAYAGMPCLSFDIIPDNLGTARDSFPHTCYMVCGTQAAKRNQNSIIVLKLSNLRSTHKPRENEDESESDSSSEDEEVKGLSPNTPIMNASFISHFGCINRIKSCQYRETMLAAAWSELGRVSIWDLKTHLKAVENRSTLKVKSNKDKKKSKKGPDPNRDEKELPLKVFSGHLQEGFALDWSSTVPGVLSSGDCSGNIHVWSPRETDWDVDLRPLKSHTKAVEDLQWSPNENNVLASCSVDKTIKIWDVRIAPNKACMLTVENAHSSDVNVISWNKLEPLIVSGGDDAYLRVWDLRQFKTDSAVATFKHHTRPVTTVEWHPTDSSVFASGGEDDQIVLWDLSVERDRELDEEEIQEIPPQLLFLHLGQTCIKELHWHPQIPGMIISTAETGFNVFKTISV